MPVINPLTSAKLGHHTVVFVIQLFDYTQTQVWNKKNSVSVATTTALAL